MDEEEVNNISALLEQSAKMNESFGQIFDGAARDSTTIFSHTPTCPAQVASGVYCNCSFSSMNLNEIIALDAAAVSGLDGLEAKTTQMKLNERETQVLSNIASFFGIVTVTQKSGRQSGLPKPLSALRMMTTDDKGRSFFGPNGVLTKSFASMRAAGMELRALVGRQAAAIRRLRALVGKQAAAIRGRRVHSCQAPEQTPVLLTISIN